MTLKTKVLNQDRKRTLKVSILIMFIRASSLRPYTSPFTSTCSAQEAHLKSWFRKKALTSYTTTLACLNKTVGPLKELNSE